MVLAVQVILVALMAEHAHRRTLTLLVAQPLKCLIALVEWHHRQHHHRHQPHHVQSHLQRLPLFLFLRHQLLLPLQLPLQCLVGEVAQSVATRHALMEITALDLSAVWMVRLAHLRQTPLMRVSCPSHPTALDDHQLQRSSPFGISMTSAQA